MPYRVFSGLRFPCSESPAYYGHHLTCWTTKSLSRSLIHPPFTSVTYHAHKLTSPCDSRGDLFKHGRKFSDIFTPREVGLLCHGPKSDCQKYFHLVGGSSCPRFSI